MTPSPWNHARLCTLFAAAVLVAGCGTSQGARDSLNQAQLQIDRAKADPNVIRYAAGPLRDADETLARARKADDDARVHHLAYLAQKKVEIAQALAATRSAERRLAALRSRTRAAPSPPVEAEDTAAAEAQARQEQEQQEAKAQAEQEAKAQAEQEAKAALDQEAKAKAEQEAKAEREAKAAKDAEEARLAVERAERREAEARQAAKTAEDRLQKVEKELKQRDMLTLSDVSFENNSAELRAGAEEVLRPLAEYLRRNPTHKIIVEGYTDSTGNYHVNMALSHQRAEAVKSFLVSQKIEEERVLTVGRGPNQPIASNDTEEGRRRNRRIEIVLVENPDAQQVQQGETGGGAR